MSANSKGWMIGLLLILALVALFGPGISAWARPGQPAQITIPTPTVLIPSAFLPLISRMWIAPTPPPENQLFLPLIIMQ